jgi:drug/metabolite transporter (DMT)-like permease
MRYAGELAALGTACCWAVGSNLFAVAGRGMGSVVLNRLRITVAAVFLVLAMCAVHGSPWPNWATPFQLALLSASGVIGFVLGDNNFFRSLVILGPGKAALVASLAPVFTAILAVPVLGEHLGRMALAGMALTLGGLYWVLGERERSEHAHVEGSALVGVLAGVLGALGQAGGYVISKLALRDGLDPLSATIVRVAAAVLCVWVMAVRGGSVGRSVEALRDRRTTVFMVGGAFAGPFLGVTLSLVALAHAQAGIAASITAVYPILTLVLSNRFHGERITGRILVGACVAFGGVVVLFLR